MTKSTPCSQWELDRREGPARMRKRIRRLFSWEALNQGGCMVGTRYGGKYTGKWLCGLPVLFFVTLFCFVNQDDRMYLDKSKEPSSLYLKPFRRGKRSTHLPRAWMNGWVNVWIAHSCWALIHYCNATHRNPGEFCSAMATVCSHESFLIEHLVSALLGISYYTHTHTPKKKSCNKFYSGKISQTQQFFCKLKSVTHLVYTAPRLYWLLSGGIRRCLGVDFPEAHIVS